MKRPSSPRQRPVPALAPPLAWILVICLLALPPPAAAAHDLLDGYRLVTINGEVHLADRDGTLILASAGEYSSVERISAQFPLIFGEVVSTVNRESIGYFLINTRTSSVREELSAEELRAALVPFDASMHHMQPPDVYMLPQRPETIIAVFVGFCAAMLLLAAAIIWICRKSDGTYSRQF